MWWRYSELGKTESFVLQGAVQFVEVGTRWLGLSAFVILPYLALATQEWGLGEVALAIWSSLEIMFHAYLHMRVGLVKRERPVTPAKASRIELASNLFTHMGDDLQELHVWFKSRKDMVKGSVEFMLSRAFFEKSGSELSGHEISQAKEILRMFNDKFKDVPDAKYDQENVMWPSNLPVPFKARSVIFYGVVAAIRMFGDLGFINLGFQWCSLNSGLGYWIRRPAQPDPNPDPNRLPILYFHGIGLGPALMIPHINSLLEKYPDRILIMFYIPHICLAPTAQVVNEDEFLLGIDTMLHQTSLTKCSVVGHSFGSIIAMWLIGGRPDCIGKLTLVDPVCYMLWTSSLLDRAYHSTPTTLMHSFVQHFIARDSNFAIAIHRKMYWPMTFQMPEDIPCPADVFIAERDWIVDAPAMYKYLLSRKHSSNLNNLNVHMNDLNHVQFMYTPDVLNSVNLSI